MGGFFATVLAERYRLPAVLVNPAVQPHTFAEHFIGEHHNPYTGVDFSLTQADIDTRAVIGGKTGHRTLLGDGAGAGRDLGLSPCGQFLRRRADDSGGGWRSRLSEF